MIPDDQISGKQIINKTWSYLGVTLGAYGNEHYKYLREMFCIKSGVGDHRYEEATGKKYEKHLYMCFDKDINRPRFIEGLEYFRSHKMYETDYQYTHPTMNLHMIVMKIHPKYHAAFETWKTSKYSKMYTDDELFELFNKPARKFDPFQVLFRTPKQKVKMEDKIAELSKDQHPKTRITLYSDSEYDFMIKWSEEIFNYVEQEVEAS